MRPLIVLENLLIILLSPIWMLVMVVWAALIGDHEAKGILSGNTKLSKVIMGGSILY